MAIFPSLFLICLSTPLSKSLFTTYLLPAIVAYMSGVHPYLFVAFLFMLVVRRYAVNKIYPFLADLWRILSPMWFY